VCPGFASHDPTQNHGYIPDLEKTPQKKPLSFKEEKRLHKGHSTRIVGMFRDRAEQEFSSNGDVASQLFF